MAMAVDRQPALTMKDVATIAIHLVIRFSQMGPREHSRFFSESFWTGVPGLKSSVRLRQSLDSSLALHTPDSDLRVGAVIDDVSVSHRAQDSWHMTLVLHFWHRSQSQYTKAICKCALGSTGLADLVSALMFGAGGRNGVSWLWLM